MSDGDNRRRELTTIPKDQRALLWTHQGPRIAPVAKPRELVWTLRQGGHTITASLLGHGEYGWEAQLDRDGQFYAGRRFALRADAVAHADSTRADLERDGWSIEKGGA